MHVLLSWCDECLQRNYFWELDGIGEVGRNRKLDGFVAVITIFIVVGTTHGVPLIAGFCGIVAGRGYINKKSTKNCM